MASENARAFPESTEEAAAAEEFTRDSLPAFGERSARQTENIERADEGQRVRKVG